MAQEKLTLTYFKPEAYQQLLSDAGFDFQDTNNGDILAVYKKR